MSVPSQDQQPGQSLYLLPEQQLNDTESSTTEDLEVVQKTKYRIPSRDISVGESSPMSHIDFNVVPISDISTGDKRDPGELSPLEEQIFNPFQLRSMQSMRARSSQIIESLNHNAIELVIECVQLVRNEKPSNAKCFVALFCRGVVHGTWDPLDTSEDENKTSCIRFIKKFRMRAATVIDREENFLIAAFDSSFSKASLDVSLALGTVEFTVAEILHANQMMLEKDFVSPCKRRSTCPQIILALQMVYHLEHEQNVTFDIGFLETAPLRNRMFFVISRAIGRGKWVPVYRSEVRLREDVEKFDPITLGAQEFHCGELSKLFRIEVYRAYKNGLSKLLGFIQTSCEKLSSMDINGQLYWWPARDGISAAQVLIQYREERVNELWYSLRLAGRIPGLKR